MTAAIHGSTPSSFMRKAAAAPEKASTDPTDRSMSPLAMTKVSPTDDQRDFGEGEQQVERVVERAPEVRAQQHADAPEDHDQDDRGGVAAGEEGAQALCAHALGLGFRAFRLRADDSRFATVRRGRSVVTAQARPGAGRAAALDGPGLDQDRAAAG